VFLKACGLFEHLPAPSTAQHKTQNASIDMELSILYILQTGSFFFHLTVLAANQK